VLAPPRFVGLRNYATLVQDDVFQQALYNTLFYAAGAIPLGILVAFSIALLLNTGIRGMAVYRTIFFLPSLMPAVAMGILWLWLLNGKSGIFNFVLRSVIHPAGVAFWALVFLVPLWLGRRVAMSAGNDLRARLLGLAFAGGGYFAAGLFFLTAANGRSGMEELMAAPLSLVDPSYWMDRAQTIDQALRAYEPPAWLSKPQWVKPAFILMSLWGSGNAVVIYLAGLQDVPVHLYEAADLDGAHWMQKIRHVTIPMMSPVILFNGIMAIIGTFNFFAQPFVMAPGGQPARNAYFLAVNLFDNAFQYLRMGYAAAMAWVLFIIVFALTMLAMKLSERHVHYGGG
jgi:ABC-type sugar transport system permease subunit